jgi:ABC-2 type transport system ATP-binding protein
VIEPESAPTLQVRGLRKSYGQVTALADVSLSLPPGSFTVLLGPNGAGKSTLFQILSGLFMADSGEVVIDGLSLEHEPVAVLARLGVVFQQATLDLDLSAVDNLIFHTRLHGIGRRTAKTRIASELERIGLSADAGKPCRSLSGGNRRKVELARALTHSPNLLLMDEPTVGLDPGSRRDLLAHVREQCHSRGLTVLWATHLVDEADEADRLVVLHEGRICADDTYAAVLREHDAASVAELFFGITQASAIAV